MSYKTYLDEWFAADEPYDTQGLNAVQDNQQEIWQVLSPIPTYYFPGKNTVVQESFRTVKPPRGATQEDIFRKFASPQWECIWIRPFIIDPGTEKLTLHLYAAASGNWNTGSTPPADEDDGAYIQFTESFSRPKLEPDNGPNVLKIASATPDYYSIDLPITRSDSPQITYLQLWYKSTTPRVKFYTPGEYWEDGGTLWEDKVGVGWPIDIIYPQPFIAMSDNFAVADDQGLYHTQDIQSNIPQPGLDDPRLLEFCIVNRNPKVSEIQILDFGGAAGITFNINLDTVPTSGGVVASYGPTILGDTPEIVADALANAINASGLVEPSGRSTAKATLELTGAAGAGAYVRIRSQNGVQAANETFSFYNYTVSAANVPAVPAYTILTEIENSLYNVVESRKILGYRGGEILTDGTPAIGWWVLPPITQNYVSILEPLAVGRGGTGFAIAELGWFQPYSIGVESVRSSEYIEDFTAKESVIKPGGSTQTRTPFELLLGDGINYSKSRVVSFGGGSQCAGLRENYYAAFPAQRPGDVPLAVAGAFDLWAEEDFKFLREPRLCPLAIRRKVEGVLAPPGFFTNYDAIAYVDDPLEVYIPLTGVLGHKSMRVLFLLIGDTMSDSRTTVTEIPGATLTVKTTTQAFSTAALVELELMRYNSNTNTTPTLEGSNSSQPAVLSPKISTSQIYDVRRPDYDPGRHLSYWSDMVEGVFNAEDVQTILSSGRFGSLQLSGFPDQSSRPTYGGSLQEEPYVARLRVSIDKGGINARVKLVGYTVIMESK